MNPQTIILGRQLTSYERSLRSWFRIVVSSCAILNASLLFAWWLCVSYAETTVPFTTWMMLGFYAVQICVMLLFISIQRPYAIAVHRLGADGETIGASILRAVSINTDNALVGLYESLMNIFVLYSGVLLSASTILLIPFGGFAAWLINLAFVPAVSLANYFSNWVILEYGIVRPVSRAMNIQPV